MEVQVGHGLLARLADVGHHPVSGLVKAQLLGQLGNDLKNMGPTALFSAVTAETDWMWALGTTRKWVGA